MAQLFRDQCRDAWNEAQTWGLWKLWLRTLPDWACTSILERLAALRERKTMTEKLANLFAFRIAPLSTFFRVFVLVFLLVFIAGALITFLLPESYASTARLEVESDAPAATGQSWNYDPYFVQTTFEIIQSHLVLRPVIDKLNLNTAWGKKYYHGAPLKTSQTLELLKARLQLAPVKNTRLISITAFSDDSNEAAQIANAVAESYCDYRAQTSHDLAVETIYALRDKYEVQGSQIDSAQADLDSRQKQFDIPDRGEGLAVPNANPDPGLQKMKVQLAELRAMSHEQRRNVLPSLIPDATLSDLLGKLYDAQQKYATLTNDYALSSVEVMRVTALINVLNQQIDDRVAGLMAGMESQAAAAKAAADERASQIQKAKASPETRSYWDAKQELEQLRESHKLLFARIEDQELAMQLPKPPLAQITDPAVPGLAPVRPNKPLNIALGAFAGIFLATGAGAASALLSYLAGKRLHKTPAVA